MFSHDGHSQNSDEGEHRYEETDSEQADKIDTIEETVADQEHEPFRFSSFGPFSNCTDASPVVYASSLALLQLV